MAVGCWAVLELVLNERFKNSPRDLWEWSVGIFGWPGEVWVPRGIWGVPEGFLGGPSGGRSVVPGRSSGFPGGVTGHPGGSLGAPWGGPW